MKRAHLRKIWCAYLWQALGFSVFVALPKNFLKMSTSDFNRITRAAVPKLRRFTFGKQPVNPCFNDRYRKIQGRMSRREAAAMCERLNVALDVQSS